MELWNMIYQLFVYVFWVALLGLCYLGWVYLKGE